MTSLLWLFVLAFAVTGCCDGKIDAGPINELAQNGMAVAQKCQAETQQAQPQCGGANANGCKINVQAAQDDCAGVQRIFQALVDKTSQANSTTTK
jgi:hypothetical protein